MEDAVVELLAHLVAGVAEHADHPGVRGEHLGGETGHAPLPAGGGEVLEEDGPEATAVLGVRDVEGDLGDVGLDAVVAPDGEDPVLAREHEGDAVAVVDVGEAVEVLVAQPFHRREEPVVLRQR